MMFRRVRLSLALPLSPGVEKSHLLSYFYLAFFSTCVMAFINFVSPFLLTEFLNVPQEVQGEVTGNQVFYNELVIILCIGLLGALSDKVGRPAIYTVGFTIVGIAYLLFPLVTDLTGLTLVRLFFAVGVACIAAMLATVMADYPQDKYRGKMAAYVGVLTGLGILLMVTFLSKLPFLLKDYASDPKEAGMWSFWCLSLICFVAAVVAFLGLKPGVSGSSESKPILTLAKEGIDAGKKPRIAIAYLSSFVSRGDLAIVGTFLSLWVVQDGVSRGLSTSEALKHAGMIFGISQTAALLWGPVMGILCDRLNRITCVAIALGLAAIGYSCIGLIQGTTGVGIILACILLGIGEISAVIASQSLIGQEAPEATRGSVVGVFGFAGAVGILLATKTGGYLFDAIGPQSPFVAMGILNGVVCIIALGVALRETASKGRLQEAFVE